MSSFYFPPPQKLRLRRFCKIAAAASFFPETIRDNQAIIDANGLKVAAAAMEKVLGVRNRRIAAEGVTDSDLMVEAARRCLARAGVEPDQLTKLLATKFIGDRILPMTAAMVQRKLGGNLAYHAVDIDGGISAFLYAFDLAARYFNSAPTEHILIVSGGVHTVAISKTDARVAFLFGDGAAALLLSASDEPHLLASYFYTNHHYYHSAGSRALKMEKWLSDDIYEKGNFSLLYDFYRMDNWKETLDFYLEAARVTRDNLLLESGLSMAEVDLVLVTENNKRLREATLETLGVPPEKSVSLLAEFGNTMSAMLPMLIDRAIADGRMPAGGVVMLISHGEGASGGGILYRA